MNSFFFLKNQFSLPSISSSSTCAHILLIFHSTKSVISSLTSIPPTIHNRNKTNPIEYSLPSVGIIFSSIHFQFSLIFSRLSAKAITKNFNQFHLIQILNTYNNKFLYLIDDKVYDKHYSIQYFHENQNIQIELEYLLCYLIPTQLL